MNRRNFFTTLFGSAITGVCAVLAPRYYPSVDGVRNLTTKVKPFPYLIPLTSIQVQRMLIRRRAELMRELHDDLALADRIVSKRSSVASD